MNELLNIKTIQIELKLDNIFYDINISNSKMQIKCNFKETLNELKQKIFDQ